MIADVGRFGAYAKAIAAAVRPGDTVADVGCGVGAFSLLACRAGARRVFAIEIDDSIQIARELAARNGVGHLIEFFQSDSRRTELPERVNVVVSDLRGVLPLYGNAIQSMEDARRRFLVAGGIMIPQRDTLKAAVIEVPEYYNKLVSPWQDSVAGLDLSSPLSLILNQFYSSTFEKDQLLTAPQVWGVIDYTAETKANVAAEWSFEVTRKGTGHGLCLWFDTNLFDEVGYAPGPGTSTVHGQVFLPWLKPVPVEQGCQIHVRLHADLIQQEYVWRWDTTIPEAGSHRETRFRQSTFQGATFSSQSLRRQDVNYIPILSDAGQGDLWMLGQMTGNTTLQSIAQSAYEHFPHLFSSWQEAFSRAAELSRKFSR